MALNYGELPHTIQWWRSLMEWVGGVGLSTGITHPDLPWLGKLTLICLMWMGRLEIIPVLLLLSLTIKIFTYKK